MRTTKSLIDSATQHKNVQLDQNHERVAAHADTVMVVDDEPLLGKIFEKFLVKAGVNTRCFSNPMAALEWYRTHHRSVAAVMLDIDMPGVSGTEFFRICRRIDKGKKIAFLSSRSEPELIEELLSLGACSYFSKPVDYESATLWALEQVEPTVHQDSSSVTT